VDVTDLGVPGMRVWGWVRRHLVVTGLVLVVLAGAGIAVPLLRGDDAGPPCGGILPEDLLDELREGQGGYEELWQHSRQLGRLECRVQGGSPGGMEGRVFVTAVTAPNDVDASLALVFDRLLAEGNVLRPLPEGLPGAATFDDRFYLMPRCPALGTDFAGEPRSMLVETFVYPSADFDTRLRMAVAATNAVAEALGCGAEPLRQSARHVPEPPDRPAPLSEAEGPCAALTSVAFPRLPGGEEWDLMAAATESSPFPTCTLWGDSSLLIAGLFGDWSNGPRARLVPYGEDGVPPLPEIWRAFVDEHGGYATALCDGEPALFVARAELLSEVLTPEHIREALIAFATDQAEQRGCTDLRIPDAPR
jgi:hypothetical protein